MVWRRDDWTPQASATWRHVSYQYTTLSTTPPVGLIPAYSWVNIDLRMTRGRYELAFYAKNLFDRRTFNNGSVGPGPPWRAVRVRSRYYRATRCRTQRYRNILDSSQRYISW